MVLTSRYYQKSFCGLIYVDAKQTRETSVAKFAISRVFPPFQNKGEPRQVPGQC
jgi:hypothetical protein